MIYIVVRKTTEWGNKAVVHAQLPEGLRYSVGLWNSTFTLPYHLFRQELARIARINRSRIAGALCAPLAEVPAGATVVPTDDDDWFSPELATTLETASATTHLRSRRNARRPTLTVTPTATAPAHGIRHRR